MISHFINISREKLKNICIFFIFLLACSTGFSSQHDAFVLPGKLGHIFWKCHEDLCTVYLKKKNSILEVLLEKSPYPTVELVNEQLIQLFFSCGSPCNYSIFYDSKMGLSQPFEFVIAADAKKEMVVVAEKEDLVAYKIFDKSKTILFSIKRDWSPTVTLFSSIIDAKFSGNAFYLKYLEGNNFKEKIEILSYERKSKKDRASL